MKSWVPILFALGTALCWGLYGPTLGNARAPEKGMYSPFKPYVGIGIAYIVWAFIGGLIVMKLMNDTYSFSGPHNRALTWGFAAGTLGALGALCLTFAMMKGGHAAPHIVMSVVFGGAVTLTALVSIVSNREHGIPPLLIVGILMTVTGIVLVASNTPHGAPAHKPAPTVEAEAQTDTGTGSNSGDENSGS